MIQDLLEASAIAEAKLVPAEVTCPVDGCGCVVKRAEYVGHVVACRQIERGLGFRSQAEQLVADAIAHARDIETARTHRMPDVPAGQDPFGEVMREWLSKDGIHPTEPHTSDPAMWGSPDGYEAWWADLHQGHGDATPHPSGEGGKPRQKPGQVRCHACNGLMLMYPDCYVCDGTGWVDGTGQGG